MHLRDQRTSGRPVKSTESTIKNSRGPPPAVFSWEAVRSSVCVIVLIVGLSSGLGGRRAAPALPRVRGDGRTVLGRQVEKRSYHCLYLFTCGINKF